MNIFRISVSLHVLCLYVCLLSLTFWLSLFRSSLSLYPFSDLSLCVPASLSLTFFLPLCLRMLQYNMSKREQLNGKCFEGVGWFYRAGKTWSTNGETSLNNKCQFWTGLGSSIVWITNISLVQCQSIPIVTDIDSVISQNLWSKQEKTPTANLYKGRKVGVELFGRIPEETQSGHLSPGSILKSQRTRNSDVSIYHSI